MKRKTKHPKGLSDTTLSNLCRKVVFGVYGNRCIICGESGLLEWHHIIHRGGHKILRWDWRNGVPVCKPITRRNCHQEADTIKGRELVSMKIGLENYEYIKKMERVIHKDYLRENGLSENKWRQQVKDELLKMMEE